MPNLFTSLEKQTPAKEYEGSHVDESCPFCSGAAKLFGCHVYCTVCFCSTAIYATPADALRAWKMRAPASDTFSASKSLTDDSSVKKRPYTVKRG